MNNTSFEQTLPQITLAKKHIDDKGQLRRRNRKTRRYGVLDTNIENMELTPLEQDDDEDDTTLFDANHPRRSTYLVGSDICEVLVYAV
ncbi:hypothetical protein llap_4989 [Limosa lapponica baueri]|uniref:Transmembrane protein 157 n=1 Tax=Limosa lapponica baueri TaxID=1758121 RepID=A0A2I0UF91_LIMLA|nr:hypothetical protein llap_4989 [Limosa lapponica baueri]